MVLAVLVYLGLAVAAGGVVLAAVAARLTRRVRTARALDRAAQMSERRFRGFVTRSLRLAGCRQVEAAAGPVEIGPDVAAYAPDGRRLTVRCRPSGARLSRGQLRRFATCARRDYSADLVLVVTVAPVPAELRSSAAAHRVLVVDHRTLVRWAVAGRPLRLAARPKYPPTAAGVPGT